jgi:DNA segregation ATPase FtsK/SpoIIIE, S-DNA-T family
LILSEDNAAARLLSRAGEAIYNDANGQIEGNHPFQVVWLGDEAREVYLREIQHLARAQNGAAHAQVVFEGNIPARIENNILLAQLLVVSTSEAAAKSQYVAWLGEAVAIKEPTSAAFASQGGSNLLIVGQNDEAALGMMAASFVSLAASVLREGKTCDAAKVEPAALPRFLVFDGAPADTPASQLLAQLVGMLPAGTGQLVSWRDLPAAIARVAAEVARRGEPEAQNLRPVFLFIHGLQRFRDLRKADDDFGFSRTGEEKQASPAKQFATILREGASLGVHVLVWCDSLNNVNRAIDRQGLREFEMRVVLQMSSGDSSSLIDTPLAAKLGMNRALSYSEEEGKFEKFRPYGPPDLEWLCEVAVRFETFRPNGFTEEAETTESKRHREDKEQT